MDIRFKGGSLITYERTLNTAVTQEDTAEMIVPDALPDAADIILTDGHSLIRGKDLHRSGVSVSGISELNILYRAEDGSLGRLPVDIPFETEIDFNISDDAAKIVASVHLVSGEGRILNSRKLLIRAEVCVTLSVWTPVTLRWAEEASYEGCSVELKSEKSILHPVCAVEEKTFTCEETLPLPAGKPQPETLLYTRAALHQEEAEQVGRKLAVRGTALVNALYRTQTDEIASVELRLPWSAFLDLPEEEQGLSWELVTSLTGSSGELTENGGFSITVGGVAQAVIRNETTFRWIADAYGTDCVFNPTYAVTELEEEAASEIKTETVTLRMSGMKKTRSLVYLAADCGRPRQERENTRVPLSAKALCVMEDGSLESMACRGEALCAGSFGVPEVSCGEVLVAVSGGNVELQVPVIFRLNTVRRRQFSILSDGEVSERSKSANGPNLVLLRASAGDSVWSLGKSKGISCAAIRSYNQLPEGEEPVPGTLLLLAR